MIGASSEPESLQGRPSRKEPCALQPAVSSVWTQPRPCQRISAEPPFSLTSSPKLAPSASVTLHGFQQPKRATSHRRLNVADPSIHRRGLRRFPWFSHRVRPRYDEGGALGVK